MTGGGIVTAGSFDGVHRGHRLLLDYLREEGKRLGLRPIAVTFDRHPLELVAPERVPPLLTSRAERLRLIGERGVESTEIPFDNSLRMLTAREWIREMRRLFGARVIVMGYDHRFGCDGRTLSDDDYHAAAREEGIEILKAPELPGVSSSAIRHAVVRGDIAEANSLLGRPYAVEGYVEHGAGIGRRLGFPTANIQPPAGLALPAPGVYAADVSLPDGQRRRAVVNIGVRPTLEDGRGTTIEAHIDNWSGDLYGRELRLEFLRRLRPEKKFASLEELKARIAEDLHQARL